MSTSELSVGEEARAYLVAAAGLPGIGPGRLRRLASLGDLPRRWKDLGSGRLDSELCLTDEQSRAMAVAMRSIDVGANYRAHARAGVRIDVLGEAGYPVVLAEDPRPPAVLFSRGDLSALEGSAVAVVGTRRASAYGVAVARQLGADLADAGVSVVSGLALGIDAAAHRGSVRRGESTSGAVSQAGRPIAVVGCGVDIDYPRRNTDVRTAIERAGVVVGEVPNGVGPAPWRFPARNRVIAALCDAVVVVESRLAGGSMITVDEAAVRGRPVLAVPGPVGADSSAGTNQLIVDGCHPCRGVDDVLDVLGLSRASAAPRRRPAALAPISSDADAVLELLGWSPTSLDALAAESRLQFGPLCRAIDELISTGRAREIAGRFERLEDRQ